MSKESCFFLPAGYTPNPVRSRDTPDSAYWHGLTIGALSYQVPVYRLAQRRSAKLNSGVIVDIGSGPGIKLANHFCNGTRRKVFGVDQPSGVTLARGRESCVNWIAGDIEAPLVWEELGGISPDLVICADVLEHLSDPAVFLLRLAKFSRDALVVLSTPDRHLVEGNPALGPPLNPLHVREWGVGELLELVESCGFSVLDTHHLLPRTYSLLGGDFTRGLARRLGGRPFRDTRHCLVLEMTTVSGTLAAGNLGRLPSA